MTDNDGITQPTAWAKFKALAKKLVPSRAMRWGLIYLPAFTVATLFALKTFGAMDDLIAYALELAPKSMHVMAAVVMTYVVSTGLGWNLDNDERSELQFQLSCRDQPDSRWPLSANQLGALLILAGEMLSILALLTLFLFALLVWQG